MEHIIYKSSEEIFSKISEKLSSYSNTDVLDMSLFYSDVHNLLRKLGDYFTEDQQEVLHISNYKVKLPSSFSRLRNIYLAETYKQTTNQEIIKSYVQPIIQEHSVEYIQKIEKTIIEIPKAVLARGVPLKYNGRAGGLLENNSLNYNSTSLDEFRIDKNFIYTNFTDKKVILEYTSFPYDEDGLPLIPDFPKVEEAIEDLLFFKIFEYMYINRYADVLNEMKYYEKRAKDAFNEAMTFVKLPNEEDLYGFIKYKRRLNRILL